MNTPTALATRQPNQLANKPKALEVMAARLNVDPAKLMGTLKSTCFKGATDEQMLALVVVANVYGLNPFLKELYAFPAKGGGIVPVVGIDGWIKMVNRADAFDGVEFDMIEGNEGKPFACTCTLYLKNRARPVKVTEYFDECYRNTEPWNQMPRRMIRHKALKECARVAFGFSGIHDEDEAIDIGAVIVEDETPKRKGLTGMPKDKTDATSVASNPTSEGTATTPYTATPEPETKAPKESGHDQLARIVTEAGFTFDDWQKWARESGQIEEGTEYDSFAVLPNALVSRLLRAQVGMLRGLQTAKEGGAL